MRVLESTHRRLHLTFQGEARSHWFWAMVSLLVALGILGNVLALPAHILTCWAEGGDRVVQCRATQRRLWRQQPQFQMAEVQEVILLEHSAPWWSDDSRRYSLILESPTGEQQTFAGQSSDRRFQEDQAIALLQYLADPQPQPWVYRVPPDREQQILWGGTALLAAIFAGILPLKRPVLVALEMDHPTDKLILTDAYLTGHTRSRSYPLSEVVKVELCHERWRNSHSKRVRIYLRPPTKLLPTAELNLMHTASLADQRRAADLMRQLLNLP